MDEAIVTEALRLLLRNRGSAGRYGQLPGEGQEQEAQGGPHPAAEP